MAEIRPYKFGFVLCEKNSSFPFGIDDLSDWGKIPFPDCDFFYDTLLKIYEIDDGDRKIVIAGDCFLPNRYNFHEFIRLALKSEDALHDFLKYACGRFILIFNYKSETRIYNDAFGSRSIFYSGVEPVFSSHASLIASILKLDKDERTEKFMLSSSWKSRSVKYLPGDVTPWSSAFYLPPNNYLVFGKNFPKRFYYGKNKSELYEFDRLNLILEEYFEAVFKFIGPSGFSFGLTAGTDNRILLSYAKQFLPSERLCSYTMRRSLDEKEEFLIKKIVAWDNINHKFLEKDSPEDYGRYSIFTKKTSINYGGNAFISGIEKFMSENKKKYLLFGHGGEVVRGFPPYQKKAKNIPVCEATALDLAKIYGDTSDFSIEKFSLFIDKMNYKDMHEKSKLSDIFYWEHRMAAWSSSSVMNFLSLAMSPFIAFNSRHVYESFHNVEHTFENIFVEMVKCRDKSLSAIPYF